MVDPLRPMFTFETGVTLPAGHAVKGLEIRTNSYWRFGWTLDPVSGAGSAAMPARRSSTR